MWPDLQVLHKAATSMSEGRIVKKHRYLRGQGLRMTIKEVSHSCACLNAFLGESAMLKLTKTSSCCL